MDVELYIYDLSRGMARQFSLALTGIQIDAIYHTAIVFGGVEYFFGQGVHRKIPGSTHHGRPMKVIPLGKTELPAEVIEEYLDSLQSIYTPESYDLFLHNCNNFSQDLAVFLVGKSIPDEIRNLPETFLRTPMGQMLRQQLDQSMRQMTQAPDAVAGQNVPRNTPAPARVVNQKDKQTVNNGVNGHHRHLPAAFVNGEQVQSQPGHVHYPKSCRDLDTLLKNADKSCAVIFFTSATCPPCKIVYPAYDELAAEAGNKATLIKVDVSQVYDIAARYQVRATPTFMTYLRGKKDQEWSGAHEARLRGNVRLLVQMAHQQHAHTKLRLPSFEQKIQSPIMYTKIPPLEKLVGKIGKAANDKEVKEIIDYVRNRDVKNMANSAIPNLHNFGEWFHTSFKQLPIETHFAIVDLIRIATIDTRVSSFLAAEHEHRTLKLLVPKDKDFSTTPYNMQVVTVQLFCNLFGSNLFQEAMTDGSSDLRVLVEQLASQCLLAEHQNARSLAAALVYNLAAYDHNERIDGRPDKVNVSNMGDLEAALVQAVVAEEQNQDTLHSLLMALGLILYAGPADASIWELSMAMDVRETLKAKAKMAIFAKEPLLREIGEELLATGNA